MGACSNDTILTDLTGIFWKNIRLQTGLMIDGNFVCMPFFWKGRDRWRFWNLERKIHFYVFSKSFLAGLCMTQELVCSERGKCDSQERRANYASPSPPSYCVPSLLFRNVTYYDATERPINCFVHYTFIGFSSWKIELCVSSNNIENKRIPETSLKNLWISLYKN